MEYAIEKEEINNRYKLNKYKKMLKGGFYAFSKKN